MTKKEKEKKVLEALDLRVGDVIEEKVWKDEFRIVEESDRYILLSSNGTYNLPIIYLITYDYEIVKFHQKTYGEYKCNEIHCAKCPLNIINCRMDRLPSQTLYECLNYTFKDHNSNIYKTCYDELNKVVENENEILN